MAKKAKYLFLFLLGISFSAKAQFGFSHEVGAFVGGVAFQSDFGVRNDFETNAGNTGFAIGLVHYLNFAYSPECNCYTPETYFNDHFKIRSELSYNSTKLNHFGKWAERDSDYGRMLKAMKGETKVTDIGMQLEYYPFSIREFTATDGAWAPFVSLGVHFSIFDNHVYSDLGPLGTPLTTYPRYLPNGYSSEGGTTWSIVSSIGTRYKLAELSDLFVELRWQYYFSDWVDGLRKDPEIWKENKTNDWNVWLNFGYIHYLD
ncbi:glutamate dehydrogenase [Flavobacterium sp. HXWNR69]|uniref:Glutamate dehydrogenase n=1 Tax=Flavobacterium fragile TaxID=2949085 RepID=A0ABT0TEG5_9FLAO|nr:glutamate dehydrogenase [Flavobacterium sp. HXWNR69]MCL9769370.1 glutamate dehydrogenase [Flavobacterium sp. HXWNR69]